MRHDGEHASGDVRRGHRGASGRGAAGRAAAGRAAAGGLLAVGLVVVPAWAPVWTPHSTHSTLSWAPVGSAVAATANQDEECPAGVLIPERGWAPDALALDAAHRIATGAGVRVAVIDSGVAPVAHLRGALAIGTDVVGGEGADATGQTDLTGHGTVVATMVAARPLEGSGLVGVAPGAQILPVR
ncbi:S8 family serine peptidase, partial [Miniimonas arenae]|uniref:S8 family serine peptidase n=1 Tax=Miniimonas arenae TaxID=676201 RepID=UPI0028AA1234